MIKTPKIFVTLRQATSFPVGKSEKIPLKKAIQLINLQLVSAKSIIHSLRISIDAYNSFVNNCQSLPTLLSVPQHTDFISIYSLIPFLARTNHQTTNQKQQTKQLPLN